MVRVLFDLVIVNVFGQLWHFFALFLYNSSSFRASAWPDQLPSSTYFGEELLRGFNSNLGIPLARRNDHGASVEDVDDRNDLLFGPCRVEHLTANLVR